MAPRSAHRAVAATIAGLIAVATLSAPHAEHVSAGVLAAFDGTPSAPQLFSQHPEYGKYDVQIHQRGPTWPALAGQHGADCSGPPASHPVTAFEQAVFVCNDHLMTSLNGAEYGLIVLTPNRMLNVANGGSVSFDLSTERMSVRDWWDVMITPWAENLALPLLSDLSQGADLQGPPFNAISISTDNAQAAPVLKIVQNGAVQKYNTAMSVPSNSRGVVAGTNQAATRQSFKFTVANGRMKFERLGSSTAPALVFWDVAATATFATGVVQFGHHSYDPAKDVSGVPATWHWDNFGITNNSDVGTAFSIQHAAPRQLTAPGAVTFPAAPSGAFLRFASLCRPIVNGVAANYQPTAETHHPEHASSYFVPIPTGSTSATIGFTNDDWYGTGFRCVARDFHVWAPGAGGPPATATNTPVSMPSATSTPTAVPMSCEVRVRIAGVESWLVKPSAFCR